jgi:hypothetical protein
MRILPGAFAVISGTARSFPSNFGAKCREALAATQRLVKRGQQLVDRADVLRREIEAALVDLRETRKRARRTREP